LVIPYSGRAFDTFWWHSFQNPNYYKALFLEKSLQVFAKPRTKRGTRLIPTLARTFAKPGLTSLIHKILALHKDIGAVLVIGVPLNHLNGLPEAIREKVKIPILYYDLDLPTSLPSYGGFTFNYYIGADLSEYDSFIITSEGCIRELRELGAQDVAVVHFGVDPDFYRPQQVEKDIDILFYGNGGSSREKNIKMMITEPSLVSKYKFVVSGRDFNIDLGNATILRQLALPEWKRYCFRSKVNLNVVRDLHAKTFATSTSRPFELAAMQCCIVSSPYNGLERWFEVQKEILVAQSFKECLEIYKMLMDDEELRTKIGIAAQNRVKKEHTSIHRARQIVNIIGKIY
jgi:spore maturation protein CgeB